MKPTRNMKRSAAFGNAMTWLCGGSLALSLLLVFLLLLLLGYHGLGYFWQHPLIEIELADGTKLMGEVQGREPVYGTGDGADLGERIRLRVGNRDVTGAEFRWIDESDIVQRSVPGDALVLERVEWGRFYGFPVELRRGDEVIAAGAGRVLEAFPGLHANKMSLLDSIVRLEKGPIGDINHEIEQLDLERRRIERADLEPAERRRRVADVERLAAAHQTAYRQLAEELVVLRDDLLRESLVMETADGIRREIPVGHIVRAIPASDLGTIGSLRLYGSRILEFLVSEPRESNTEGGIFPAIFGTVMMVFLMVFAVTPLGVLAAVYLREYAREGWIVRAIRIAVNNLAGVPSIVFGVFGLGFFVYLVGGSIDRLFYPEALPAPTFGTGGILWGALTLALLTVPVVIVATEEGLAAVPREVREGSLALGATKFETTWRVVVPAAAPGMLTGIILAMARAAGEVAPLMIVGMVKLAPALPVDGHFPYVHLERKFMHLGFHIYDVGFQSPNVEATKPLVFATALLLVGIVVMMNMVAIAIRNRLRKKYASSAV